MSDRRLSDQIAYYGARSGEYDEWALRAGRHDRGDRHRERWLAEWRQVEESLRSLAPYGDVLELAAGTGLWTRVLAESSGSLTAVDASSQMLAINRARPGHDAVAFIQADLFGWRPPRAVDLVAFGFWISHIPDDHLVAFFDMVSGALRPGGRVWFVDSTLNTESSSVDLGLVRPTEQTVRRRLNDGSEYEIVKVFHDPAALTQRLATLGWDIQVRSTGEFFYVGCGGAAA
jgi:ubiquinone/menaquinone biosynthesis C-methylase UbiE